MSQIKGNGSQFLEIVLGVAANPPPPPSRRALPNHTLLRFYFRDIQDLIVFENVMKMFSEYPRLQEIGANF